MQTRRTKKADQGPAVERNQKKSERSVEDDQGGTGSHRPKRTASKGIESAIQAAKGVKRAVRKKADRGESSVVKPVTKALDLENGPQKETTKQAAATATQEPNVTTDNRPRRAAAAKKGGKEATIDSTNPGQEAKGGERKRNRARKTKALKPEDIVQMLGNDVQEEAEEEEEEGILVEEAPVPAPSERMKVSKTSKAPRKNVGGKKTSKATKKLKPDEIRDLLDNGENKSEEEEEEEKVDQGGTGSHQPKRAASKGIESAIKAVKGVKRGARKKADVGENKSEEKEEEEKEGPAKKAAATLAGVVSKGLLDCTSDKVPVYKMGATKKEEEKTSGIDIYDAFNPIYEDELGHEDKKAKARRAAKARRLAKKKKEEAKIILTFGAAARENVVPAIKNLKNLKTPTQQNHRR